MAFSVERFLSLSKAVETRDLDYSYIAQVGVTDDEARTLRYMADVESHTIIYLRDVLVGHTARDPEITAFLSCWVYEEFNHGRAIDQFLTAAGRPPERDRYEKVTARLSFREELHALLTTGLAKLTIHLAAAHMAWGALSEMMAASAYTQLAYYTQNRELTRLLLRLAKDERRHQSFYFHQAEKRMQAPLGRALARFALNRVWSPVGMGVGEDDGIAFIGVLLYDDERGQQELRHMDHMISRLPGMAGFGQAERWLSRLMADYRQRHPEHAREIAQRKQRAAARHDVAHRRLFSQSALSEVS